MAAAATLVGVGGVGSVLAPVPPASAHDEAIFTSPEGYVQTNYTSESGHYSLYACANRSRRLYVDYKEVRGSTIRQMRVGMSDYDCRFIYARDGYTISRVRLCGLAGCTNWKST